MTQTKKSTNTPVERWIYGPSIIKKGNIDVITEETEELICLCENEEKAKIIVKMFNSYLKHFGPDALEAAEQDVLGEALKALKDLLPLCDRDDVRDEWLPEFQKAEQIISKTKGNVLC